MSQRTNSTIEHALKQGGVQVATVLERTLATAADIVTAPGSGLRVRVYGIASSVENTHSAAAEGIGFRAEFAEPSFKHIVPASSAGSLYFDFQRKPWTIGAGLALQMEPTPSFAGEVNVAVFYELVPTTRE